MNIQLGIIGANGKRAGPRPWQSKLWDLHRAKRFLVSLVHRRAGKTVGNLIVTVREALESDKASPQYAFVSPTFQQAKQTAWLYLKQLIEPIPGCEVRESDLTVILPNHARIILASGENYERLRGLYLDGVVMDEIAHIPAMAWTAVIRPALSDRQGWAIFSGTSNGQDNLLYSLREYVLRSGDADWGLFEMKASEAARINGYPILSPDELAKAEAEMSAALYQQEYELSFTAAARGAYYAEQIRGLEMEGRFLERIVQSSSHAVHGAADLGWGDLTAAWVGQDVLGEVRVQDYVEDHHKDWKWYLDWFRERGVTDLILPHDARNGNLTSGQSVLGQTRSRGFRTVVIPQTNLMQQVEAGRRLLDRAFFDYPKTADGLARLREYKAQVDKLSGTIKRVDKHDDNSHAGKAWAYFALGLRPRQMTRSLRGDYQPADRVSEPGGWMSV